MANTATTKLDANEARSAGHSFARTKSTAIEAATRATTAQRAYATFAVKAVDDEQRIIEGIASTPTPDRMDDVVEPMGAEYALPLPALLFHKSDLPVGEVVYAKPTKDGIPYRIKFARAGVFDWVDKAWALVKERLVRGVSIGFRPLEWSYIEETGGIRFLRWEWLELSLVTIPANSEATIATIKSFDAQEERAALGAPPKSVSNVVRLSTSPGAAGNNPPQAPKEKVVKTIGEQIQAFESKRAADVARMSTLMEKAAEDGRTLDTAETEEYDTLDTEVKSIDQHLVRLKGMQSTVAANAQPASNGNGSTANVSPAMVVPNGSVQRSAGESQRQPVIFMGKNNLPKGTAFTRYAMMKVWSQGNVMQAAEVAKRLYQDSTPEVGNILSAEAAGMNVKTAVAAGTTTDATWASPLVQYQNLSAEFVELLRPETIVGRIPGLRRVPFVVRIPSQTTGVSAGWVGQGAPKPVGKPGFTSTTMDFSKIAVIVAMTEELVRFSNPSAEEVVRNDMIAAIAQFTDEQFISPGIAAVSNVSPASITYGLTPVTSSGSTIAQIVADFKGLAGKFVTSLIPLNNVVMIMHPNTALALSLARTSQDIVAFPGIDVNGGTFNGIQVITSASVPYSTSGGSMIVLLKPSEIFLADDGQVTLDASREASLQMDSAPSAGAQSLTSLWQNNLIGLRAERYINWQRRRSGAVAYIDMVAY